MAEEKKPSSMGGGKPSGSGKSSSGKPASAAPKKSDPTTEIFGLLIMMVVAVYLINGFLGMFAGNGFISNAWNSVFPSAVSTQTRPISSLLYPIGARVAVIGSGTDLYDIPGGKKINS